MMSHDNTMWSSGLVPMIEPEIVTEIISHIADLALVISSEGKVIGVLTNPSFKARSGLSRLEGQTIQSDLTGPSVPKFNARLEEFLKTKGPVRPVEINHAAKGADPELPVRYSFHRVGTDGSILLLGHDLRPIAEMQQQLVAAQIALERDYEAQREYDTRLRVLMAATRKITLFISVSSGEIVDCNPGAAGLFGKGRGEFVGSALSEYIAVGEGRNLIQTLVDAASQQGETEVPVTARKSERSFMLHPTLFRTTGAQMLLCRMSDSRDGDVAPDGLRDQMLGLFENGADGIVFVNAAGTILSANESFLQLAEVTHTQAIKGRSVVDFLGRGNVDLNVIRDNAARSGSMRLYATRLVNEHGGEVAVEIATAHFTAAGEPVFAMVVRDASRNETMRSAGQQVTDVDMRSVIELIGSQTLKEIVAKTTDVIEKMCIETAVDLTSNNRVAAAEMLGLSRQSLYVKLRKYELLKKDAELE